MPGPDGEVVQVRGRCRVSVAGWEQHIKTFGLTGYNGMVPCGICRNVIDRCDYFEDDYFVHCYSSEHHRFHRHTPESFKELIDSVKHVAGHSPGEIRITQQTTGVKWDPNGLLFDEEFCSKWRPPFCHYPGFMHTFVSSGGIAQHEVNGLVLELGNHIITTAAIDEWCVRVKLPVGTTRLAKTFFQKQYVS